MKRHAIKQQMYEDLRETYSQVLKCHGINMEYVPRRTIVDMVLSTPAPRFYINSKQAAYYVLGFYNGNSMVMRHKRRDMIEDLVARYEQLRKKHPYTPQSMIWEMLVESPAPKYYITHDHATAIIFNHYHYRKNARNERPAADDAGCAPD